MISLNMQVIVHTNHNVTCLLLECYIHSFCFFQGRRGQEVSWVLRRGIDKHKVNTIIMQSHSFLVCERLRCSYRCIEDVCYTFFQRLTPLSLYSLQLPQQTEHLTKRRHTDSTAESIAHSKELRRKRQIYSQRKSMSLHSSLVCTDR